MSAVWAGLLIRIGIDIASTLATFPPRAHIWEAGPAALGRETVLVMEMAPVVGRRFGRTAILASVMATIWAVILI